MNVRLHVAERGGKRDRYKYIKKKFAGPTSYGEPKWLARDREEFRGAMGNCEVDFTVVTDKDIYVTYTV